MGTDSAINAPANPINRNAELMRFAEEYAAVQQANAYELDDHDGTTIDGAEFVIRRNDYIAEIVDGEKMLSRPRRPRGTVNLTESASFVEYLNRYASGDTVVYVAPRDRRAIAVINDHPQRGDLFVRDAGWRDLRANLEWRRTDAWQHWIDNDRKMVDQETFAEHIEEGLSEIASPPGADLLEMAQSFKAAIGVNVRQARYLRDGRVSLAWEETIEATAGRDGQMTIPSHIGLLVAPFEGAARQPISARLRYRLRGRTLELGYLLDRPVEFERAAIDDELAKIKFSISQEVDIVIGKPE